MSVHSAASRGTTPSLPSHLATAVATPVARRIFALAVHRMRGVDLRVTLPDGSTVSAGRPGPRTPEMIIHRDVFFTRLATSGKMAFGEGYMAGEWDSTDLCGVLLAFARNLGRTPPALQHARRLIEERTPRWRANTLAGAARNISHHYDLSNELFALMLDSTMTYSCAVFAPGDSLEDAQRRKYDAMAALVSLDQSDHLLEIGTGWGGMAMHAAEHYGCRVTTTTISQRQHDLAVARIEAAGLSDRITVLLKDYRSLEGQYSKIVSIEMFEAVGEEYWPGYFAACDRLLAPTGTMALQTITMPDAFLRESRHSENWIQRYIFPGGAIPSHEAFEVALRGGSRLRIAGRNEIGPHYATTLREWSRRFNAQLGAARALGFDDGFARMWNFYLAFCEAGFRAGALGDSQYCLRRP